MRDKPCIIWTEDGSWFQQTVDGVVRSSWMGKIGTPDEVREMCAEKGLAFFNHRFTKFQGTAVRERWPEQLRSG